MKKCILALMLSLIYSALSFAADGKGDKANKFFYTANTYYEKGDYARAVEDYIRILDSGIESGNLYYNIGNSFLKLGKIGYAVLCYEKARRYIPGDSDLKSNLDYAKSFVEKAALEAERGIFFAPAIKAPFRMFNLNTITVTALLLYLVAVIFSLLKITMSSISRKIRPIYLIALLGFFLNVLVFALRYYDEELIKHGIVVQKEAECKYEPIEKSTTYYKINEGQDVGVLKTRNGWRQIRRHDGRVAWVKKEAVEEI